jgi:hypothetical protein
MLAKGSWLLIVITLILLIGAGSAITSCTICQSQSSKLRLSRYPGAFKTDTLIVVGENASPVESDTAETIATNLKESKGDIPVIMSDAEVTEEDKEDYNLIIIGIKDSNVVLTEVCVEDKAAVITDEYPGENRGIIKILPNPWNSERIALAVAGSDEKGVEAGNEILIYIHNLEKPEVMVDWEHLDNAKKAVALGLTPDEFGILDRAVHEYLSKHYSSTGVEYSSVVYYRLEEKEYIPGLIVVRAELHFIFPSPSVIFGFYCGKAFLISGLSWEDLRRNY